MNQSTFKIFDRAFEHIFEKNRRNQITLNYLHPNKFSLEFASASVNLGRCSGHTSYIASRARPGDLIVIPTMLHRSVLSERTFQNVDIVSLSSLDHRRFLGISRTPYPVVWVDECSNHKEEIVDFLYDLRLVDSRTIFMFLGGTV